MNLLGKVQTQYEQLWKEIIRPPRAAYSEQTLGPNKFKLQGQEVIRQDFQLTNSRGLTFQISLWNPTLFDRNNCLLYLHERGGNRLQGMEYLGKLIKAGLGLCTFDFSSCGNAQGEYVGQGYFEQQEVRIVIQYLKNQGLVGQIALWGRGMGSIAAMLYLSKTVQVKCAIFDSPFRSLKTFAEDIAKRTLKVPSLLLGALIKMVSRTIQEKAGFSIYNINPLKYTVPGLHLPAFFIAALDDQVTPHQHTKDLFSAFAGESKILKLVKGKHNDSRPQDAVNEAVQFLIENLGHDWKKSIQKPKKEFDFIQLEKLQKIEQETLKKQQIDFFAEVVEEIKYEKVKQQQPKYQNQEKQQQTQKHQQHIESKKGDFSLSGLMSFFSRKQKQHKPEPIVLRDGYEQLRAFTAKSGVHGRQCYGGTVPNNLGIKQNQWVMFRI